jgi:hypothetical protein
MCWAVRERRRYLTTRHILVVTGWPVRDLLSG